VLSAKRSAESLQQSGEWRAFNKVESGEPSTKWRVESLQQSGEWRAFNKVESGEWSAVFVDARIITSFFSVKLFIIH
jgi:hypothetical protein